VGVDGDGLHASRSDGPRMSCRPRLTMSKSTFRSRTAEHRWQGTLP
jgi:hypothetical protein